MTHVVMLFSREYAPDVRVQKEAQTLALAGYRVTVLAWDRLGQLPAHELEFAPPGLAAMQWQAHRVGDPQLVTVTRIHIPAGYHTGLRLIVPMLHFWLRLLGELRRARPSVIHANDLDMLPVALLYHWLTGVPVIYDAREYYPGMVRASVGSLFSRILDGLEWLLAPRAAAIITVGERLAIRYRARCKHVQVVHNSHPPFVNQADSIEIGPAVRRSLGIPEDALLIMYVGMLTPDRLIAPLLEAIPTMERVWLAIGGIGPQALLVEQSAARCAKICWLGHVPLEQVPPMVRAADVVYYGLDAHDPNSFYFMPNLAFFAFGAGRPLLVTPVGEIAEIVRAEQCGLVMELASVEAMRQGLLDMQDARLRATLGERARLLGQHCYHWGIAAETLFQVYREVLQEM